METPNPELATATDVPETAVSERDSILAELDALGDSEDVDAPAPSGEEQPASEDEDVVEETEAEAEDLAEEEQAEEEPEPDVGVDATKLAALQRQELRQKEAFSRREQELQAREKQMLDREATNQERLDNFDNLRERASYDAAGVLEALGVTPESFEETAKDLFSRRPGAKTNPVNRNAIKAREIETVASKALARVEELEKRLEQKDVQADLERRANKYMDVAETQVTVEDSPILANLLKNSPAKFREFVGTVANKLYKESGETPEHVDLIAEMENTKRAELLELGIEPPRGLKQSNQSQKKTGRTITNDLVSTTKQRAEPVTEEEFRHDVLKGMADLDI